MQVWPVQRARFHLAIAILLAVGFGWITWLAAGWLGALVGLAVGSIAYWVQMRRYLRRRRLVRDEFPDEWRRVLRRCVAFYRQLDGDERQRFQDDIRFFLAEQRIYGPRGAVVDDEVKVMIAASAAILGHGLPDWEWPRLRDIVVYPAAFDSEYRVGPGRGTLGMVHARGPILFSADDLMHGFCKPNDGLNVGLHELAHVMDFEGGRADGVPGDLSWVATAPWIEAVADRIRCVRAGDCTHIYRRYAGKNEAEFFAVAVEVFFEQPGRLQALDPELYEMLSGYFNQDPASSGRGNRGRGNRA